MKTMGLHQLRLISPLNPQGRSARALAHGAEEILEQAAVVDNLEAAIADAVVVTGTTARKRQLRKHALLTPANLAEHVVDFSRSGKVVILFGTERTGLTNDEADICRYLSTVDTAATQPSLNLAQAVMLYAWEIRQALLRAQGRLSEGVPAGVRRPEMRVRHPHRSTRLPTQWELDNMYGHLAAAMAAVGYPSAERTKFLTYLRQLHLRAGIVDWETHIFHLFCRRILQATDHPPFTGLADRENNSADIQADEIF